MCGIVGLVDARASVSERVIVHMRDALAHRGPDGAGVWISDAGLPGIGLGHRRLAIIDRSSAGHQPMSSNDGRYVLVFNGEIYNYRELQAELERLGHRCRGASDTEVLLAAYSAWGSACVERFNGMWAFAIWDTERRTLFASRDRLGKKPFYYFHDGRRFVFASEMKALFRHPDVSCQPCEEALDRFCRRFAIDSTPRTMFAGIQQLPPAHSLTLDAAGHLETRRYWSIDPEKMLELASTEGYVERFRKLFQDAVRLRLRADVAVGSSLSGGLDSSLIVGTVADIRRQGSANHAQRTFSARFPATPTLDEGPFIDAVVKHTDVEAHTTNPSVDGLLADMRELHRHQEEPFLSSSIYAQWTVMRSARQRSTVVLLDGQGSDELLAGYVPYLGSHLFDLATQAAWGQAWTEYRRFTARQREFQQACPGATMRTPSFALGRAIARHFFRSVQRRGAQAPSEGRRSGNERGQLWNDLHEDLTARSIPSLLRYADRNSMAFGVEVRNPFLDYRLVEFLMQIPNDLKIRDGWLKWIQREAGRGTLPEVVRTRTDKVGFVTPEDEWLRGGLRSWAEGVLFGPRLRSLPGYSVKRIARLWNAHQSRRRNLRAKLWPWLSLHEWLTMIEAGDLSRGGDLRQRAA